MAHIQHMCHQVLCFCVERRNMFYRKINPIQFSNVLKATSGSLELFLSIPVLSWFITVTTGVPVFIMLVIHTFSLIIATKAGTKIRGNVLGLFASFLAVIPVLGWLLHVITAIVLLKDIFKSKRTLEQKVIANQGIYRDDY